MKPVLEAVAPYKSAKDVPADERVALAQKVREAVENA